MIKGERVYVCVAWTKEEVKGEIEGLESGVNAWKRGADDVCISYHVVVRSGDRRGRQDKNKKKADPGGVGVCTTHHMIRTLFILYSTEERQPIRKE